MPGAPARAPIRDAATVILLRDAATAPRVLMGQRGARAAFLPNKVVFPGGAVDSADRAVPLGAPLGQVCSGRLGHGAGAALAAAAIRELAEETGLRLACPGRWPAGPVPEAWTSWARAGHLPDARGLSFVFRAVTPPGRPRRFDARFFLADARHLLGDPDDFSDACDELSNLQWVPLGEARGRDLPFITEVVLAEVAARLPRLGPPPSVPFFDNSGTRSEFRRMP
ncbi:DNA mismatch repair protein MutT [Rhodobacteraceae bacterium WD3A24]|nr:DNA mismatch repair protein MutT [Rhodobacteraceae bacterium WD3A24]